MTTEQKFLRFLKTKRIYNIYKAEILKYWERIYPDKRVKFNLQQYMDSVYKKGYYNIIDRTLKWDLTSQGRTFWYQTNSECNKFIVEQRRIEYKKSQVT